MKIMMTQPQPLPLEPPLELPPELLPPKKVSNTIKSSRKSDIVVSSFDGKLLFNNALFLISAAKKGFHAIHPKLFSKMCLQKTYAGT